MDSKSILTLNDGFLPHFPFILKEHLSKLTCVVDIFISAREISDTGSPLEKLSLVEKKAQVTRQHLRLRCLECFEHRGKGSYLRIQVGRTEGDKRGNEG